MDLKPCKNPTCERLVLKSVDHCCGPCIEAHNGGYEIHESGPLAHTSACNERWAQRKGL